MFTDGGARGNPGPAGLGVVLLNADSGEVVAEIAEYLGEKTNNQAEYMAVLRGVERAKELGATELECFMDSQLVAEQLSRNYKIKNAELAKLFVQIWNLLGFFKRASFTHIPREQNKAADKLVNKAIDAALQGSAANKKPSHKS